MKKSVYISNIIEKPDDLKNDQAGSCETGPLWKKLKVLFSIALTLFMVVPSSGQEKEVIGYYPSWKWRYLPPDKIPFSKLTCVNYAFFYPLPDGHLVGRDTVDDAMILGGVLNKEGSNDQPRKGLTTLAHENGVRVILSVGGWDDSGNFPKVAKGEASRWQFAHSCIEAIKTYSLDGIDLDWEYPTYVDHGGKPEDKENCTRLLKSLRDSLDVYGRVARRKLVLSAALPATEIHASGFDIEKIAPLLDYLNIMTYDLNGEWDSLSGHNAPLYSSGQTDTNRNVDAAFRLYTQTFHVPSSKVNIGIPFYGHSYAMCTALYAPHAGADTIHFSKDGVFYNDIVETKGKLTRFWDDRAKVPYAVDSSWNSLVSYDDEESVALKAQYVLDHHAGGVIIWEITGDRLPDGDTPLLDVLSAKLLHRSLVK
jgi:GH18 family chitinase